MKVKDIIVEYFIIFPACALARMVGSADQNPAPEGRRKCHS